MIYFKSTEEYWNWREERERAQQRRWAVFYILLVISTMALGLYLK